MSDLSILFEYEVIEVYFAQMELVIKVLSSWNSVSMVPSMKTPKISDQQHYINTPLPTKTQ